jgi:hypothetical protein
MYFPFEKCPASLLCPGHENKDLISETINSFRLFDILKLWEAVHHPCHGKLFQKGK